MINTARFMGLLSDVTRLRILMLLARKELCVCQIMGVLGISQPLISRNLAMLNSAGILNERKDGKLVFYSLNREMPKAYRKVINILQEITEDDTTFSGDIESLKECSEYQKKTGKCDMKTFREFMERRRVRTSGKRGEKG